MTIEVDLREIKSLLSEVSKKLDSLLLEEEPDIYSVKDIKAKVNRN
jgi:hypothetical protein